MTTAKRNHGNGATNGSSSKATSSNGHSKTTSNVKPRLPIGLVVLFTAVGLVFLHLLAVGVPLNGSSGQDGTQEDLAVVDDKKDMQKMSWEKLQSVDARINKLKRHRQSGQPDVVRTQKHEEDDQEEVGLDNDKKDAEDELLLLGKHKLNFEDRDPKFEEEDNDAEEGNQDDVNRDDVNPDVDSQVNNESEFQNDNENDEQPQMTQNQQQQENTSNDATMETRKDVVLLISSHQRLILYNVDKDMFTTLEEGKGIYYGMFPGDAKNQVWVSRNIKVGPTNDALSLYDISKPGSPALKDVPVSSQYMHDAVLKPDRSAAFVADVFGTLMMLQYPISGSVYKRFPVFTKKEHINTIAVTDRGTVFVMLHNIGPSKIVELDLTTGERVCEINKVGKQAHGLVVIEDGKSMLILSSKNAALVKVTLPTDCIGQGGQVDGETTTMWKYEYKSDSEPRKFLKGLAVVDGVAYFGMSDFQASRQARINAATTLVAFDLVTETVIWMRENIGSKGLVNVIGMPFVAIDSSYREIERDEIDNADFSLPPPSKWKARQSPATGAKETTATTTQQQETANLTPIVSDNSCVNSFFSNLHDSKLQGFPYGLTGPNDAFYKLPLRFNVTRLREEADMMKNMHGYTYRADVNNYFILFVTKDGELEEGRIGPFSPVPDRLEHTPYMRKVMDSLGTAVGRSRFMMLKAGESVKRHNDDVQFLTRRDIKMMRANKRLPENGKVQFSHSYWGRRFRVHIPIYTHPEVKFISGESSINMEPGYAYLFDNGNPHAVDNHSPVDRVHLIMDTVGSPKLFELMKQAQVYQLDGTERQGSAEIDVPYVPGEEVTPVYENWADANAYEFMKTSMIRTFMDGIVSRIGDDEAKESLKTILEEFYGEYSRTCSDSVNPSLYDCNTILQNVMTKALELFQCHSPPLKIQLSEHSVVRPIDALETIVRMSYFQCQMGKFFASLDDEAPASDVSKPIIPLPGHKYRLPMCVRSRKNK